MQSASHFDGMIFSEEKVQANTCWFFYELFKATRQELYGYLGKCRLP